MNHPRNQRPVLFATREDAEQVAKYYRKNWPNNPCNVTTCNRSAAKTINGFRCTPQLLEWLKN